MQYEKYEAKVKKIADVLKSIFRHMTKIIICTSVVLVITAALLATKGIIVSAESCPEEITYGEELGYSAKAFLSKVKYEYKLKGSDEWTENEPTLPGEYRVRAAAKALFGYRYSDEESFILKPKELTVGIVNGGIIYGSDPVIVADTVYEDSVVCDGFVYNEDRTSVVADIDSVKVLNSRGDDVTSCYVIKTESGDIYFIDRPITVTVPDSTRVYDGTPLTSSEYKLSAGTLAEGDRLFVTFSASITDAGTVRNSVDYYILNGLSEDVTEKYSVTLNEGNLTVTRRDIIIETASLEVVYDGTEHSRREYYVSGGLGLAKGDSISVNGWTSLGEVGSSENYFGYNIFNSDGEDVKANYSITEKLGTLTVNKRPITVSTGSVSTVYDGDKHYSSDFTVKGDYGLAPSHTAVAVDWDTYIDVGSFENRIELEISDAYGEYITDNYSISYEYGSIEITKRSLAVTTGSESFVYDDTEQGCYDLTDTGLAVGDEINVYRYSTFVEAGVYENAIEFGIYDFERGKDVTANYEITVTNGTVTIERRAITVKSADKKWTYDGYTHYEDSVVVSGQGLAYGHSTRIDTKTELKAVSKRQNVLTVSVFRADTDVSANYIINYEYGTVEVEVREITVVSEDAEKIYDGEPLYRREPYIADFPTIHTFKVISSTSITDAGTAANVIEKYDILDESGESVLSNYSVKLIDGSLTVKKRPIIITTESAEKIYDAKPLTASGWLVSDDSVYDLVLGHKISANTPIGSQTNAGVSENGYTGEIKILASEDVTGNYDITPRLGTLTVNKRPVIAITDDINAVYDAKEHYDSDVKDGAPESGYYPLCDGHSFVVTDYPIFINAQTGVKNTVEFYISDGTDDVGANYDITERYGMVNIAKRPIVFKTEDIKLVYDGKDHYDDTLTVYIDPDDSDSYYDLCDGHYTVVTDYPIFNDAVSGKENLLYFYITDGTGDLTDNYDPEQICGKVDIAKRPVTFTTNEIDLVYDGQWHSDNRITLYLDPDMPEVYYDLCDGHIAYADGYLSFCDAVEDAENEVSVIIKNGETEVNKNYDISVIYGAVNIAKRPVHISTVSYNAMYDGLDHTDYSVTYKTTDGKHYPLCDGHTLKVTDYLVIKDVISKADNAIEYYVAAGYSDVTKNYIFTESFGEVNVSKRPITVVSSDYDGIYDGYEHSSESTLSTGAGGYGLCTDHSFKIKSATSIKNVVKNADNDIAFDIIDGKNVTVSSNYDITLVKGKINVEKFELVIITGSKSFVYDGTEKKYQRFTAVNADAYKNVGVGSVGYLNATTVKNVGSADNSFDLTFTDKEGKDSTANFKVVIHTKGVITVTERRISVKSGSRSKSYDGYPLYCHEMLTDDESENPLAMGHTLTASFTGSITEVGSVSNYYDFDSVKVFNGTEDVTSNYDICKFNLGTLEIKERTTPSTNIGLPPSDTEGDGDGDILPHYTVLSEADGRIYLKLSSYGAFNGNSWSAADEYSELYYGKSASYILPLVLQAAGKTSYRVTVKSENEKYAEPYYTVDGMIESDVMAYGNTEEAYTLRCFIEDYYDLAPVYVWVLSEYEAEYREFVYGQYLDIDTETMEYMRSVIIEMGFDKSDDDIITKVAEYIRGSAVYDLDYNRSLDSSYNVVLDFLSVYRRGVCQHYASAATMLYRALGIPARYTEGYVADVSAGVLTSVTKDDAHAWVEVYVDGLGWMKVEVTGSSSSDDSEEIPDVTSKHLEIRPTSHSKLYDGTPLVAENEIDIYHGNIGELLAMGYTYSVVVSGSITDHGTVASRIISFVLYDEKGNDVTDEFVISYSTGTLKVIKGVIKIYLHEKHYEYSGIAYHYDNDEYVLISAPAGTTLVINSINISLKDVGSINSDFINSCIDSYIDYSVYESGSSKDVGDNYGLEVVDYESGGSYTPIYITKRFITIETNSATKSYDGTPLVDNGFFVKLGALPYGHRIEIDIHGSVISGSEENTVNKESLRVYDEHGNIVSSNYDIEIILGILSVV